MPLQSQLLRGLATLEACASGAHEMTLDEPDATVVTRVQDALADLGYLGRDDSDGIFRARTGKAVTAFKIDVDLSPTTPVIGTGTMAAFDAWFADEPDDPDSPDASTSGWLDLAVDCSDAMR